MSTLTAADTIDLADVGRAVRRGWRAVIAFVILGTAAAVGLIFFAPPKFSAVSTIVLRTGNDPSASILSRVRSRRGLPSPIATIFCALVFLGRHT